MLAGKQSAPATHGPIHPPLLLPRPLPLSQRPLCPAPSPPLPCAGCKEVTTVPSKPGIAFIGFETEMQASVALTGLQGFKVTPQNAMKITYSK